MISGSYTIWIFFIIIFHSPLHCKNSCVKVVCVCACLGMLLLSGCHFNIIHILLYKSSTVAHVTTLKPSLLVGLVSTVDIGIGPKMVFWVQSKESSRYRSVLSIRSYRAKLVPENVLTIWGCLLQRSVQIRRFHCSDFYSVDKWCQSPGSMAGLTIYMLGTWIGNCITYIYTYQVSCLHQKSPILLLTLTHDIIKWLWRACYGWKWTL